jgi:hypothetical protein
LDDEKRGVVVRAEEIAADDFGCAVGEDQAAVVAEERVAQGRFDADTRRPADKDEGLDLPLSENVIELGLEEAAVAVLETRRSPGWGASSGTMLVFHVPSIKKSPAPTPKPRCFSRLGASGPPRFERSRLNSIFRYTTVIPAAPRGIKDAPRGLDRGAGGISTTITADPPWVDRKRRWSRLHDDAASRQGRRRRPMQTVLGFRTNESVAVGRKRGHF